MFNDLIEDFNFPDLFTDEPITFNITQADAELIRMLPAELKAINDRIARLETASNIQTLRMELEKAKRQKLGAIMTTRNPHYPSRCPEATSRNQFYAPGNHKLPIRRWYRSSKHCVLPMPLPSTTINVVYHPVYCRHP